MEPYRAERMLNGLAALTHSLRMLVQCLEARPDPGRECFAPIGGPSDQQHWQPEPSYFAASRRTAYCLGDRFTDSFGMWRIGLLLLDVGLHVGRRHYAYGLTKLLEIPRPIMWRGADLDTDQACRQLSEESQDGPALQLPADQHFELASKVNIDR
jgi:hypothetical protein